MAAALRSLLANAAFQHGVKFGLAGVLAIFLALLLRLQMPTSALFTVFVLMMVQYVGAIAEKSFFRLIGTVIGAALGYVITAGFEQNPVIMLTLTGGVVAISTAMFGQSRYPYAFLLCGMTVTIVVSNGYSDPANAWKYAIWRTEEVTLGVLVVMLVQSVVWPHYARDEFLKSARDAFADLRSCFEASAQAVFTGGNLEAARRAEGFPARISALRVLLDFGARESRYFRSRLDVYFEMTTALARIASSIATLSRSLPPDSFYPSHIRLECEAVHRALAAALGDLASESADAGSRTSHRETMDIAFTRMEDRLIALRADPAVFELSTEEVMAFAQHILAADEIRRQIERVQELLDTIPADRSDLHTARAHDPLTPPLPSRFWIRTGIKTGLAVAAALVLNNWLKVPGGVMFIFAAWEMTAINAYSPGGRGDQRAFHFVIYSILVLLAVSLLLLAARPLLSSYAVMNLVLFVWLFLWGWLTFRNRAFTLPSQLAMLMLVGILALNGQEPIAFQQIVQFFFGLAFAVVLSAVIQRLLWPSLPQWEMRDRFVELLGLYRRILGTNFDTLSLWQKTRMNLIPEEILLRISRLTSPVVPEDEQSRLTDYLGLLRQSGFQLEMASGHLLPFLPSGDSVEGHQHLAALEAEMTRHLEAHEQSLRSAKPPLIDPGELTKRRTAWVEWATEHRTKMLRNQKPALEALRFVGFAGVYAEAARGLLLAHKQAANLRLSLYMGDYAL